MIRRIDPRRPGVTAPSGLRRIVLGSSDGDRVIAAPSAQAAPKPLRSAGPFSRCTLVVSHAERGTLDAHAREVVAAAAVLAGTECEVVLAVLGDCRDDAAALGVDRLLVHADHDPRAWQPASALLWLDERVRQLQPLQVLLPDRGGDADLGRRYALAAGLDLACGVVELGRETLRMRCGPRHDALRPHATLMLLARGVADADLPFVGLGVRDAAPAWPEVPVAGVRDLGVESGAAHALPLDEAELVLAAGDGVADLPLFHALAQALGAAVGASRVAVDKGRFARHQQVGATGKTITAAGYVAIGISGAVQHLQGIKGCRHVIAVNCDAAAPIVRRADLGIVEDSTALMRELLHLVRGPGATRDASTDARIPGCTRATT
ncbi:MAG TPA: FAD-binding protein [Albitalea sp.]|uniref:electron transfer flavoprotein subunit alpha/FixB family protein n=1 Tax=Piscinibacter sp. TaxID=1903157 RepID=UPI002ED4D0EF